MHPSSLVVIDANVLVAAMVPSDSAHEEAKEYIDSLEPPLYVPVMALAEALHLIERDMGHHAELAVLDLVLAGEVLPIDVAQWEDIGEIANRYSGSKLGTVDASVITTAEFLGTKTIATTDLRMHMVTTTKNPYFNFIDPRH